VADERAAPKFIRKATELGVELLSGESGLEQLASAPDANIVLNGVVGAGGLKSTLAAARAGKRIALANKESMVAGGELVNKTVKNANAEIIPVDSEHSAIFQCLMAGKTSDVRRLILTSSGGPFRKLAIENFRGITVEQALQHPTWNMGRKITIDSATLMNKGLEIIEAVRLFGMPASRVDVVIHPQSIVHSMVEFNDGAIISQLSRPDMRLPIQYALFYPERKDLTFADIDFSKLQELNFESPDETKFPSLKLAREAIRTGGTAPAALNAANEVAVESFLSKSLSFPGIFATVEYVLEKSRSRPCDSLDSILAADKEARELARQYVRLQSV
jgi:1-deoxy-D-xylulose-5-phosphate reductoisomerase